MLCRSAQPAIRAVMDDDWLPAAAAQRAWLRQRSSPLGSRQAAASLLGVRWSHQRPPLGFPCDAAAARPDKSCCSKLSSHQVILFLHTKYYHASVSSVEGMPGSIPPAREGVALTCLRALHGVQPRHVHVPKHTFQFFIHYLCNERLITMPLTCLNRYLGLPFSTVQVTSTPASKDSTI